MSTRPNHSATRSKPGGGRHHLAPHRIHLRHWLPGYYPTGGQHRDLAVLELAERIVLLALAHGGMIR